MIRLSGGLLDARHKQADLTLVGFRRALADDAAPAHDENAV